MTIISATIGASEFLWGASSPQNLGFTQDGGKFIYEVDLVERTAHESGTTPYEICVIGRDVRVEALLIEETVENLLLTLGSSTSVVAPLDPTNEAVEMTAADGEPLPSDRLILHPIGGTNYKKDVVLWKACVLPQISFETKVNHHRIYKVVFKALVSEDSKANKRLARFGDYSIVPSYH